MNYLDQLVILLHAALSFLLAGILGYERESSDKPAGLRTNMFIAGSACLMIELGTYLMHDMVAQFDANTLSGDPTRLLHAIVIGVSFIGGGTILKSEKDKSVKYLTTAATLLFSTCIGISVALKLYWIAIGITAFGLIINHFVHQIFERKSQGG